MIRQSPCELYTKYLIALPDDLTNSQIQDRLCRDRLDYIGEAYLNRLRGSMKKPSVFRPFNRWHRVSSLFIKKHKLHQFFFPDSDAKIAISILKTPRVKEFVEAMVLARAPEANIGKALCLQYGTSTYTERSIQLFRTFYWDVDKVDSVEIRALLSLRYDPTMSGKKLSSEESAIYKAMGRSSYNDPRKTIADLPISPLTAYLGQMRMGIMPCSPKEMGRLLSTTRWLIAIRLMEAGAMGQPEDGVRAMQWSMALEKIDALIDKTISPDAGFQEQIQNFKLKTDSTSVPFIHELTGGKHTLDVQAVEVGSDDDKS